MLNINWMEILDVIIRATLSLITLFLVTKMLGKKQVSQLSLFDYVIGISIGNFAAEMTINLDTEYIHGVVAVLFFGLIAYIISKLTLKSIKLRRYFTDIPAIFVEKGKLIEDNFKKNNFDINDFLQECRAKGYFNLENIEYAILEANGTISILPKVDNRPITVKDMKLKIKQEGLCANVIIDGQIMERNLKNINKDEEWLKKQLKIKGENLKNILLATVDIDEKLVIYNRSKQVIGDILE